MKLKFIFNIKNHSPAGGEGQREASQRLVTALTGENHAASGKWAPVPSQAPFGGRLLNAHASCP